MSSEDPEMAYYDSIASVPIESKPKVEGQKLGNSDKFVITHFDNKDTFEAYRNLAARFVKKKLIYLASAKRFNNLDLFIFTIPLLIMQVANVIIPTILGTFDWPQDKTGVGKDDGKFNAKILKVVSTCISAVSASWIAAQARFDYGKLSEKYSSIATTYDLLASNSFVEMTKVNLLNDMNEREAKEKFAKFLDAAAKIEKNAVAGVKFPPYYIEQMVMKKYTMRKGNDEKLIRKIKDMTIDNKNQNLRVTNMI